MLKVECLRLFGFIEVNCYVCSGETGHAFVIDPGCSGSIIMDHISKNGLKVEKILLTHAHFDHFGAAEYLREKTGADIYAHEASGKYLGDTGYNLSTAFGTSLSVDGYVPLKDGQIIDLDGAPALKVIHTPGHTEDSVTYYSEEGFAFTGDTVFRHSYGNTSFPGGDMETLRRSITDKVLKLPEDTVLYSGHTEPTDVKEEKRFYRYIFRGQND